MPALDDADLVIVHEWNDPALIASFLVLGLWPKPALDVVNPAITKTLQTVGIADPAPSTGAQATSEGSAK